MRWFERIAKWFEVPVLTRPRIWFAMAVALGTDGAQYLLLALGPLGFPIDEALDVVAMVLTCAALGFHLLLLPTFILEAIPVAGLLPTWTGCVAAVIMLRKAAQSQLHRNESWVTTDAGAFSSQPAPPEEQGEMRPVSALPPNLKTCRGEPQPPPLPPKEIPGSIPPKLPETKGK